MRKIFLLLVMLLFSILTVNAQTRTISGKVTDKLGRPADGASVQIRGTTNGTVVQKDGSFSISVAQGDVLVISAINLGTKEIAVDNTKNFNVVLDVNENVISEVVVTAAGISRNQKSLGYSVTKVDPNDLIQKSEPDVLKSLQGKVPGVDIRTSQGTPGAATRIQIRGNSSFSGTQPLIIVDGVPYSNNQVTTSSQTSGGGTYSSGIGDLDPNDIASFNVLKGATASALYGSRAAGGVIVITTKSGNSQRSRKGTSINFRSSYSIENIAQLPDYQNNYGAGSYGNYSNSNGSWGPKFGTIDSIATWPQYAAAYPELFSDSVAYKAYPNNVKDLFKNGEVYENSISVSSGDEKSAFALTASNLYNTGYVPNTYYKRTSIGVGGSTVTNIGLVLKGNLSYTRGKQLGGQYGDVQYDGGSSVFARSLFLARNWDLNLPYQDKLGNPLNPNGNSQYDNPWWSAYNNTTNTDIERMVATIKANYKINSWAAIDYTLGTNVEALNRKEVVEVGSRAAISTGGSLTEDNYRHDEIESTLLLTFNPKINDDFSFTGILGHNYNQRTTTRKVDVGNGYITKGIHTLTNTKQQIFSADLYERRRLVGVFGDATLGYKNYAFINATLRNDWSSTLPVANQHFLYSGVSGSFVFSDALKINKSILNYGKIRGGYAKVGNDADPYSVNDVFLIGTNFLGQPTAGLPLTANDPILEPEFTKELELGTDLGFLNNRVELDFTFYSKITTSLIGQIVVPPSSGYSQITSNFGKISNKGIEIGLTVRPIRSKDFNWEVYGAFTKNKNIVKELSAGVDRLALGLGGSGAVPYAEEGKPFGYLRGTVSYRDSLGNLLINPATGTLIESTEEGFIGDPNPDFKLGVTNTFTYKSVFLSALFDMTKGGDIFSLTIQSELGRGVAEVTDYRSASWVIPGVYGDPETGKPMFDDKGNEISNTTRLTTNELYFSSSSNVPTFASNGSSEWSVYDATVYRLRELTLGYEFPKTLFNKIPIQALSLSFTARNIWYMAPNVPKGTNFDPESNSFGSTVVQGIELSSAPSTKRFGVNLNVTF